MIMIDQSKRLSEPLRWTRAGRLAVILAAILTVLALAALGVYALQGENRGGAAQGCIDVTFPSTLGAANLYQCGARARQTCATPGAYKGIEDELRTACTRAGYTYGAPRPAS